MLWAGLGDGSAGRAGFRFGSGRFRPFLSECLLGQETRFTSRPGAAGHGPREERGGDVLVAVSKPFPMAMRTSPPRILSIQGKCPDARSGNFLET